MDTPKIFSIYAEMTPNPMAMKFVADRMLLPEGAQLEFLKKEDAVSSPVAMKLFDLPFVKGVYITTNFITVLKNEKAMWDDVVFDVRDYIKEFMQNGGKVWVKPVVDAANPKVNVAPPAAVVNHTEPTTDIEQKIIEMLDQYVKPAVENDGGMILFQSFKDGVVTLQLKGACSGCPSSSLTLKSAVEQMLKRMVPEVKEVQQEMA
ncbi:MAG TPA: NifU family protein [Bacteroidia bacterium]|nr:NifU family protein [Bacteroidia bacterium]